MPVLAPKPKVRIAVPTPLGSHLHPRLDTTGDGILDVLSGGGHRDGGGGVGGSDVEGGGVVGVVLGAGDADGDGAGCEAGVEEGAAG